MTRRPDTSEHSAYLGRYIATVPDGDITITLDALGRETVHLLSAIGEEAAGHRYAVDKWTVRSVVGHLIDCERVFAYRALRIARGDATPLPGFDENAYAAAAGYDVRSMEDVLAEFAGVRTATISLLRGLPPEAWSRIGTASNAPISVRALAWAIAGHELHHRSILRDQYRVIRDPR